MMRSISHAHSPVPPPPPPPPLLCSDGRRDPAQFKPATFLWLLFGYPSVCAVAALNKARATRKGWFLDLGAAFAYVVGPARSSPRARGVSPLLPRPLTPAGAR